MKIIEQHEDFSSRLVQAREDHGLLAKDVAGSIGVNATTMSRFENGVRTPSIQHINKLAEFIPVNLHWLITGRGPRIFRGKDPGADTPFEIIKDDLPGEGKIIVPGGEKADMVYQLSSNWMEPRILEGDFIFVDWVAPSTNDMVAFRHKSIRVMAGWLRDFDKDGKRVIEAEKPQNGFISESECNIIGRVISSVRVAHYR